MVCKDGREGRTELATRGSRESGKVASIGSIQPVTTMWHDGVEPPVVALARKVSG
jgi:hypothetical protein